MTGPAAYLDHAAAPLLDPRVVEAMRPFLGARVGSPSSLHEWGRRPAEALERARDQVAALVGAEPEWIIFTSGATEARNLAVTGLLRANRGLGRHIVASAVEHPATVAACRSAVRDGAELDLVAVDGEGVVDPAALAAAVRDDTALVAVVHGQPDIGTLQDPPALVSAARAARAEARVVIDAGETAGLVPVDAMGWGADAVPIGGGLGGRSAVGGRAGRAAGRAAAPAHRGRAAGGRQARRGREPARPSSAWGRPPRSPSRRWTIAPPGCAPSPTGSWPACWRCPTCG